MTDNESRAVPVEGDRARLREAILNVFPTLASSLRLDEGIDALMGAGVSLTGSGLREAAQALYDEASETFPDEWIGDESSMAMSVTVRGRTLSDLRAALSGESGEPKEPREP